MSFWKLIALVYLLQEVCDVFLEADCLLKSPGLGHAQHFFQPLCHPLVAILDFQSVQKTTTFGQQLAMIIHHNFQFHPPCSIGEDHYKFQPIRGFDGPWQPCWITDRNNTWLDHANEHSCHAWSHLLQWFSRRRLKCLQMDDRRQVMAITHLTLWVR